MENITFPQSLDRPVLLLACALHANATSSYRDARNMSRFIQDEYAAKKQQQQCVVKILTDSHSRDGFFDHPEQVELCQTGKQFLDHISQCVQRYSETHDILFTLSSHGYTTSVENQQARAEEKDDRDEYVRVKGDVVRDHHIRHAIFQYMHQNCRCFALIDTCHSGTMLDLPYTSTDGGHKFHHTDINEMNIPKHVYCISACSDNELDGEDISQYGGWGGKLISQYLDSDDTIRKYPLRLFQNIYKIFLNTKQQKSHPIFSCTTIIK